MDTFKLIYSFKLYQFILENEKRDYLKSIIKAFSEKKEYNKFFQYFIKNWSKSNFLNFENLTQDEILERTDNTCEIFHKIVNDAIGINHPKISFLIDNLKTFTKMKFDELIESMVTKKFKKNEGFNIYKDIFNFISTIKDKYKAKISYDLLNNFEEDERSKIKDIILINYKRYF